MTTNNAALRTLGTLELFDRRVVMAMVTCHHRNAGNPNVTEGARRRYLERAEVAIRVLLGRRGLVVDPYLAAFRALTKTENA